jgi:hypothetical protein
LGAVKSDAVRYASWLAAAPASTSAAAVGTTGFLIAGAQPRTSIGTEQKEARRDDSSAVLNGIKAASRACMLRLLGHQQVFNYMEPYTDVPLHTIYLERPRIAVRAGAEFLLRSRA